MTLQFKFKKYLSKKMLVILLLGFSSGLPLSLISSPLQAWYKSSGVDIVTIGLLGLVGQPYSYKFFWAPLLDRFSLPYLTRRRGWIVTMQLLILLLIAVIALFDPAQQPLLIAGLALVIAFLSASQDVVIDAYRTEILETDERGLGAAFAVEGYRIAMLVAGGVGLILADNIGWQKTYWCMGALLILGMFAVLIADEPELKIQPTDDIFALVKESFLDFLQKPRALLILFFIVFYKLGDAFSHSLSTVFLLDIGFSLTAVGTINKVIGLIATLIGVLFGGVLLTRINLFKALLGFGILQAATNLLYMLIAIIGKNYALAATVTFAENLCAGMGTSAFIALLMGLCNPKFTATQYAVLSSLMSLGRVYVGPLSGYIVKSIGWTKFYFATAIFAVPGLVLLVLLRGVIKQVSEEQRQGE